MDLLKRLDKIKKDIENTQNEFNKLNRHLAVNKEISRCLFLNGPCEVSHSFEIIFKIQEYLSQFANSVLCLDKKPPMAFNLVEFIQTINMYRSGSPREKEEVVYEKLNEILTLDIKHAELNDIDIQNELKTYIR